MHWYSGELSGTSTPGYFSFDAGSIVPGQRIETLSLLIDFWMELRGYTYTEADVMSANVTFRADGSLSQVTLGTSCELQQPWQAGRPLPLGTCGAGSTDRWDFFLQYDAAHRTYAGAIGDRGVTAFDYSLATTIEPRELSALPEPAPGLLAALGLAISAGARRRTGMALRAAASSSS